jgi:hypothetical protein
MSAPASAHAWAKATPRPEDAPVMTTTLSRRKRSGGDWAVAVADRADIVLVMMV